MRPSVGIAGSIAGFLVLGALAFRGLAAPGGESAAVASEIVGPEGGVAQGSRVDGVRVAVPAGALTKNETIRIIGKTALPAPFRRGVKPVSEVVTLTRDSKKRFQRPVSVTIAYSPEAVGAAGVPVPFYWNVERQAYVNLTTTAIDRAAHTVTFRTLHFTDFVLGALSPHPELNVDTGYRPQTDGWGFANYGALGNDGNCAGMVISEIAYFDHNRGSTSSAPPLGIVSATLIAPSIELVTEAQNVGGFLSDAETAPVGSAQVALQLITAMKATGDPQSLNVFGTTDGVPWGHAVTVYGYEDGHFLVNDPNYPGHAIWYDFDPDTGAFGDYLLDGTQPVSPTGAVNDPITSIGLLSVDDYDSATSWAQAQQFESEANANMTFDRITLATATVSSGVAVVGTASSTDPATAFDVFVNGQDLGSWYLDASHGFSYTVASSALGAGNTTVEVELMGSTGSFYGGGTVVLGPNGAPVGAGPTAFAAFMPPPPPPPPPPPTPGAITILTPTPGASIPGLTMTVTYTLGSGPAPFAVFFSVMAADGHQVTRYEGMGSQSPCYCVIPPLPAGSYTLVADPSMGEVHGPSTQVAFTVTTPTSAELAAGACPPGTLTFLTPGEGQSISGTDVTVTWYLCDLSECQDIVLILSSATMSGVNSPFAVLGANATSWKIGTLPPGNYQVSAQVRAETIAQALPGAFTFFTVTAPAAPELDAGLPPPNVGRPAPVVGGIVSPGTPTTSAPAKTIGISGVLEGAPSVE